MKFVLYLTISLLFLICSGNHLKAEADNKYISVEIALSNNTINLGLSGLGGHQEECIEMKISNLLPDSIFVVFEPGRILQSKDANEQDIVIVKERRFAIGPLRKIVARLFGFCAQSKNSSPAKGSIFSVGKMGNEDLITLAKLIDKNNFPTPAIQHAIWILTDNNPISSIHHDKPELIRPLLNLVCKLKRIKFPWYMMIFEEDTAMLFSGRPQILSAQIDYYISNNSVVDLNLRNEGGKIIRKFITGQLHNPDKYTYNLKLNVANWRPGKYYLHLYADAT